MLRFRRDRAANTPSVSTGIGHRRCEPARPPRNALRRFTFVRHHDAPMASFRPALTETRQRNRPSTGRPVNSGPRPCLFDVGFPLSGLQDRTYTSDLNIRAQHTRRSPARWPAYASPNTFRSASSARASRPSSSSSPRTYPSQRPYLAVPPAHPDRAVPRSGIASRNSQLALVQQAHSPESIRGASTRPALDAEHKMRVERVVAVRAMAGTAPHSGRFTAHDATTACSRTSPDHAHLEFIAG